MLHTTASRLYRPPTFCTFLLHFSYILAISPAFWQFFLHSYVFDEVPQTSVLLQSTHYAAHTTLYNLTLLSTFHTLHSIIMGYADLLHSYILHFSPTLLLHFGNFSLQVFDEITLISLLEASFNARFVLGVLI